MLRELLIELGNLWAAGIFEQYETVTGEFNMKFFKKIREAYASMDSINSVVDGASYHRSIEVVEAAKFSGIKLQLFTTVQPQSEPY